MLLWFAISLILGLLLGACANWAADVLPAFGREHGSDAPAPEEAEAPAGPSAGYSAAPLGQGQTAGADQGSAALSRPALFTAGRWLSRRALVLTAAMVVGFAVAALRFAGQPFVLVAAWVNIFFLLLVVIIDIEHRLVLNVMTIPAALLALLFSLGPGMPGPASALLGGGAALLLFLLFAVISRGRLGAGDVKLAAVIGLMLGWPSALAALFLGVILGGLGAVLLLLLHRAGRKSTMAYAPYLSLGALAVLLRFVGG